MGFLNNLGSRANNLYTTEWRIRTKRHFNEGWGTPEMESQRHKFKGFLTLFDLWNTIPVEHPYTYIIYEVFEFTLTTAPGGEAVQDVLSAVLAEIGFDSFVHTGSLDLPRQARTDDPRSADFAEPSANDSYKAYIQQDLYDEEALKQALLDFPFPVWKSAMNRWRPKTKTGTKSGRSIISNRSWWETAVSSPEHSIKMPQAEYNITINPQMSFGTGHHATTSQMIQRILDDDMGG